MTMQQFRPPFAARALSLSGARLGAIPGLPTRFLIEREGEQRFALVEHTVAPGVLAAWPHLHTREDEFSFVLEGQLSAKLGDDVIHAGPGELVFKPREQVHAFWNQSDRPVRFLEILSPAGFERFFDEISRLEPPTGPDPRGVLRRNVQAIGDRYGLRFFFDQIEPLCDEFGLQD